MNFKSKSGNEAPSAPATAVPAINSGARPEKPEKETTATTPGNPTLPATGNERLAAGTEKTIVSGRDNLVSPPAPVEGVAATVIPPDHLKKNQMTAPVAREETAVPAAPPPAKPVTAGGWGFFFLTMVFVLATGIFFAWRRLKKEPVSDLGQDSEADLVRKPTVEQVLPQRQIIDFAGDNTREVVDLISAPLDLETLPPKQRKTEFKPESTGNFEIRV